ncbi:MAG TPA: hypothetical protein VGE40_05955, partial [Bacilli bacterium]
MNKIGFASTNLKLFAHFQEDMFQQGIELEYVPKNVISEDYNYAVLSSLIIDTPFYNLEDLKWCKHITELYHFAVFVITHDQSEHFKQTAYNYGAKNVYYYPSSSIFIQESRKIPTNAAKLEILDLGEGLQFNAFSHSIMNNGVHYRLSETEHRLLGFFIFHQNQMLS